jgi:hypothetical protein
MLWISMRRKKMSGVAAPVVGPWQRQAAGGTPAVVLVLVLVSCCWCWCCDWNVQVLVLGAYVLHDASRT